MSTFHFKNFAIRQTNSVLKVGTDAMILGAFIETENRIKGLDIGAGTGVLAMMQAQKSRCLKITALEIDEKACLDARYNFENSSFANQLILEQTDFKKYSPEHTFDLIFSNPPYYQNSLKSKNSELNAAKHIDELTPQVLCEKVAKLLAENGCFWLIWPYSTSGEFEKIANENNLFAVKKIQLNGKPNEPIRTIFCFGKSVVLASKNSVFTIRDEFGNYTEGYKIRTSEFHNKQL